jgi:long-chain acyl-CoA synthetase
VRTLAKHRINMFPAVNTLFNALANDADFARLDFSDLVVSNGGGMAVQRATAEKWLKVTGCPVVEGYGLSETSPVATSNRLDMHRVHRHHRPARPQHRDRHPRRRRQ